MTALVSEECNFMAYTTGLFFFFFGIFLTANLCLSVLTHEVPDNSLLFLIELVLSDAAINYFGINTVIEFLFSWASTSYSNSLN